MQRYRINYRWLFGVFVGSLVLIVTAYFIHHWQVERKAGYFLKRAEEALAKDDPAEAFDSFRKYVQLRPKEDDARLKMANAAAKVIKSPEVTFEKRSYALGILDQTVRTTDDPKLRRELADIWMLFRRPQDAIGHIEGLLADNPTDPELSAMQVRALYQAKDYKRVKDLAFNLIGYDKKTEEFDRKKASLVGETDVYTSLAELLVERDKNIDLARRVIEEMIAANADSPEANLRKSLFLTSLNEKEEAKEFLDKAYQLDPKNAAIISRKGMVALDESSSEATNESAADSEEAKAEAAQAKKDKLEEAKKYYAEGLKEHEKNPHFYRMMAEVEQRLEQTDSALEILDEGIKEIDEDTSIELVLFKINLLLNKKDYAGVEREIKRLVKLNRPDMKPLVDFQRARIKYSQQKWSEASSELKRVSPLLLTRPDYPITVRPPNFQVMAQYMLGISYESQGINDLALQAYSSILTDYPNHTSAKQGRDRMLARRQPKRKDVDLDQIVKKTLELPEDEQDWSKVEELIEKVIIDNELTESRQKLLRAQVLIKRGKFKDAQKLIRQAADDAPEDIDVHFAAVLLVHADPEQGPASAIKLLDRLEKKWGRSLRSIAQRADLLVDLKPEDVTEQLRLLANGTEELTEAEKNRLVKIIGLKFEQLGQLDDAREFYAKSAAIEPNNLPIRMHLFNLAFRQRDDVAMQEAQKAILEFVKSEDDPSYVLTEVKRRIMSFSRGGMDPAELAKSRALLDKALLQRPKWHELHITYGQLLLLLNQEMDLALQHFDEALEYGPAKSNAVSIQVKLLVERGLFAQARERMERLNKSLRPRLLGRLEAEILNKTGDKEAGFAVAEKLAASQPENPSAQIWFSKIAQQMGKFEVAVDSLRSALEKSPSDPNNWIRLVGLYAEQKKFDDVQSAIREAHLASEAENLPLLTGKYFEILSRWQNAESIYLATFDGQLDRLSVARKMAEFYLLWSSKDKANIGKAAPYINRILRAANEGEAAADNPHVIWARQSAARIFFNKKDYQQSIKAERLLRQSAVNNVISDKEAELLTDILIARDDPRSLLQAKELLTQQRESDQLTPKGALQLARLLSRTNQWSEAQSLMLEQIAEHKSDPVVWTTYISLMIDQGEYSSAERSLKRLRDLDPRNPASVQLGARLASERGDPAKLNQLLTSLLPKLGGAKTEAEMKVVLNIAQLAERFGDYELAEKLYRFYTSRLPDETYYLARFLANHGNFDEALDLMKRLYSEHTDSVVLLASSMISDRRGEIGDKYDEPIDRLIDTALREDPDSVTRQLARAGSYETQAKYEQSIAAYERLLQRDDIIPKQRAAAMNNLGFQLALLDQRLEDAEQLIDAAIKTFGPVEDMLDTRAVVRISQGKYDQAIEDLKLALSVSRDPVKYFHLAKAYILAGDGSAAKKAWKKAQSFGFKKESLPALEKPSFEQIVWQIESDQA